MVNVLFITLFIRTKIFIIYLLKQTTVVRQEIKSGQLLQPSGHFFFFAESLNELEDQDLDALVADLRADSTTSEAPADSQTCKQNDTKTKGYSITQQSEPVAPSLNSARPPEGPQMVTTTIIKTLQ